MDLVHHSEKGRHHKHEERMRRLEEEREVHPKAEEIRLWLERHRHQEAAASRRRELVDHTTRRRQQARGLRQNQDSGSSGYVKSTHPRLLPYAEA